MKAASEGAMKGVLGYTEDKVVATDFRGEVYLGVRRRGRHHALDKTFVKVVAWARRRGGLFLSGAGDGPRFQVSRCQNPR